MIKVLFVEYSDRLIMYKSLFIQVRACEHVEHSPNLFAAPQCLGYRNEYGPATRDMCLPSKDLIVKQMKRIIRGLKDVKSVFVASDSNHMIKDLKSAFERMEVTFLFVNIIFSVIRCSLLKNEIKNRYSLH